MFSENYSVCLNDDGSARALERNGPVVTYKAIGYDSGRAVAMQLIPLTSIDEVDRVRFEESARMAQKLDDSNIARVFDVGIEDDHLVFVTEYLEGETAKAWIDAHGPMPADAVLRIGHQVMNALAAAATHSLTHRSIQPANQSRASPHQPLRSLDLCEISLAKCFAQIPRNVRRIRPRLRKKFTCACKRRNGGLPLLVALDRPRSQQFRYEKRSVSLPLLL